MKKTLYLKFILGYIVLGIIGFVIISTLGSSLLERALVRQNANSMYREATAIASKASSSYFTSVSALEEMHSNLQVLSAYQDSTILLIRPNGELLINTSEALDLENAQTLAHFNPAAFGYSYYSMDDFYGHFEQPTLSVMVPITSDMSTKGYISIHRILGTIYAEREELLSYVYIIFLILFLCSLLILVIFTVAVYDPLRKITHGANQYVAGDLKYNIPVKSDDEMGYLGNTLNYMSDELDHIGEYQRQFVSNVSHDFRSPLTSIKGYIEAILDGTIPSDKQDHYLNIVLNETDRLNKLTQSLLVLDNFDVHEFMLDISTFDINQIIKDTAASFGGSCMTKNITIELHLIAGELDVNADVGKIQQVLYNLIDNALKFSKNNSSITVETRERYNTVFVSVKDTGEGIPKSSLSKIWDRFYKSDTSRGKDRKGTGLGLSIVKEIVNAHGQNITVVSTEGIGTEFTFSLEKTKTGLL
jgi:Signal transduction histidine kinase